MKWATQLLTGMPAARNLTPHASHSWLPNSPKDAAQWKGKEMIATKPKGAYAASGLSPSSATQCLSLYCLQAHILNGASWHAWTSPHIEGPQLYLDVGQLKDSSSKIGNLP